MIRLQIQSDAQDNALDIVKAAIAAEIKRLDHLQSLESFYEKAPQASK